MNWDELKDVAAWGQYLYWAQLNVDRWICADKQTATESIATSFQFFASMYVVIEGWEQLNIKDEKIDNILEKNKEGLALLRRARNAVYHFQKTFYGEKITDFAYEFAKDSWVIVLHYEFIRFLSEYPKNVYPFQEGEDKFVSDFNDILGWRPEYEQT